MRGSVSAFINQAEVVVYVAEHSSVKIFIGSEEEKWDESGDSPKFCAPGQFGLGLPPKNLSRNLECHGEAEQERNEFGEDFAGGGEIVSG